MIVRLLVALAVAVCRAGPEGLRADLDTLAAGDPSRVAGAWTRLVAAGADAAELALSGFSDRPEAERLARAHLLLETAGPGELEAALELAGDPSPGVRRELARLYSRPDLGSLLGARRRTILLGLAGDDPDPRVRRSAIDGLGALDEPEALGDLARLASGAPEEEAIAAVATLPEGSASWEAASRLVLSGFAAPGRRPPDLVLAEALPLYGRLLAERPGGGAGAAELIPVLMAQRHPSREVRSAAARAYERLFGRLRELGEEGTVPTLLGELARAGLDRRLVDDQRARLSFYPFGDARAAREAARAMRRADLGPGGCADPDDRPWNLRSLYLEAIAELGLGDAAAASGLLERARAVVDGLLGERRDLQHDGPHPGHVEALNMGSLVDLGRALAATMSDEGAVPAAIEMLRAAQRSLLEAQLAVARAGGAGFSSWNALLDSELSPYRLLFTGTPLEGIDVSRALELQARLGRLLATAVPEEFPGFEPYAERVHPLSDPEQRALLAEILLARAQELSRAIQELQRKVLDVQALDPGQLPDPEELQRLQTLRWRRSQVREALDDLGGQGARALRELRIPASLALWLARDLREEGRTVEARRLALSMREDLERAGILHGFFWGLELLAEIEMAIGSSWIDEGEPRRAESELQKAVERLESIEQRLVENGASQSQTASVRALRCSALVSLAVNANVKLRDPERALGYYERAYALRQDEFMRVLLACYRARSGRGDEARVLLREVRPGPQTYYNLACTHALLGETERALEFLERELQENRAGRGARERQMRWAREDPDLARLRGDPRFDELVGAR